MSMNADKTAKEAPMRQNRLAAAAPFLAALILAAAGMKAQGAFNHASQSVPADAMGGAFVAKADDSSALFINPAGLSQLGRGEFSLMYGKPMAAAKGVSLAKEYAVLAMPVTKKVAIGCGGSLFDAAGLMKEYEGIFAAALRLTDGLSVGGAMTYLSHGYSFGTDSAEGSSPAFDGPKSKGALGLDLGLQASLTDKLSLGLSGRHLNRPDVGLVSKDQVPMELRGGLAYRMRRVSVLADVMRRDAGPDAAQTMRMGGGLEWQAMDRLALRAGGNNTQLTAGFGITLKSLRVDYAFDLAYQAMQDSGGNHKLAVSIGFGPDKDARRDAVSPRRQMKSAESFWIY